MKKMEKFGLIGDPIAESLSPTLFGAAYQNKYTYDLIEGQDFDTVYQKFIDGYQAINVTSPFKEKAFKKEFELLLKGEGNISGPCYKIGATNLLVKTENGIEAHNTDFTGVIMSVAETLFPGIVTEFNALYKEKAYIKIHQFCKSQIPTRYSYTPQALIVGCGGAGKAAAIAAAEMGFETTIMNRTLEKAQTLSTGLPEYHFIADPLTDFVPAVKECDLIIYTLPTAIDALSRLTVQDFFGEMEEGKETPGKIILESNYTHPSFQPEKILQLMQAGGMYVSGKQWLLYQALSGYSLMTGDLPALHLMEQSI